jgi:hypothetical protein
MFLRPLIKKLILSFLSREQLTQSSRDFTVTKETQGFSIIFSMLSAVWQGSEASRKFWPFPVALTELGE